MITSTTNEFEGILRKKDWMELLKIKQQKNKVVVGLWRHLETWGEILPLMKTIDWIDMNKETRNLFHREAKWRAWVIYKHHK